MDPITNNMGDKRKTRSEQGQEQEDDEADAPNAKKPKRAFQQDIRLFTQQGISPKPKTISKIPHNGPHFLTWSVHLPICQFVCPAQSKLSKYLF